MHFEVSDLSNVKFYKGGNQPLELHKVRVVQELHLVPIERRMERGTVSSTRDENGKEIPADVELLRLAVPRRVFTLSQINYVIDRMHWLYDNRHLIGGLRFVYEPNVLRFFMGGLEPTSNWPNRLMEKFREDFGDSL